MEYHVLVTFDLSDVSADKKAELQKSLKRRKWIKADDSAWKKFYDLNFSSDVIKTIKNEIEQVRNKSNIEQINYAFEMSNNLLN